MFLLYTRVYKLKIAKQFFFIRMKMKGKGIEKPIITRMTERGQITIPERIRERLEGDFRVADAAILPFDDGVFDGIISFSVFFYFSSLDYAARVLNEMRRVLRPGGSIFIGDVNDAAKKDLYYAIREDEGRHERKIRKDINSTHLFYEKGFFIDYASKNGFDITVVDEDKMGISYYSCALYRFSVVMKDKEGGS